MNTYSSLFNHYSNTELFHFTLSILTILSVLLFYQDSTDKTYNLLKKRDMELSTLNNKLTQEIEIRKATEIKLNENVKEILMQKTELERMNKLMVGRELRMAEMKKELEELRTKLNS